MKRFLLLLLLIFSPAWVGATTFEIKYNTAQWFHFILKNTDQSDDTGKLAATMNFKIMEGDAAALTTLTIQDGDGSGAGQDCATDGSETPESGDLCEVGNGHYRIYIPATSTDVKGNWFAHVYAVTANDFITYPAWLISKTLLTDVESDRVTDNKLDVTAGGEAGVDFSNIAGTLDASEIGADAINVEQVAGTKCQITGATSGLSFTIGGPCKGHDGGTITLATDMFVGSYLEAFNRSGTQCPVVGEQVFVEGLTSGGVVTVKDSDLPGSGFSATPSTTDCDVMVVK